MRFDNNLLSSSSTSSSFVYHRIRSLTQSVGAMLWSIAQTSKMPDSDGSLCSGQLLMMWSAVCCGSPHLHAALSHFFTDALYRPTPVCSLFRVVQCFQLRSSQLAHSSVSDSLAVNSGVCRMLPTHASTLPQSLNPSTGPQGCHLLSPEPTCCRFYGT